MQVLQQGAARNLATGAGSEGRTHYTTKWAWLAPHHSQNLGRV